MNHEPLTTENWQLATGNFIRHLSRGLYKSAHFMLNKPNLRKAKMNVRAIKTKGYENNRLGGRRENKPNQTQSQVAFRKSRRELSIRPMYASPTEPSTPESRR
jgi:hypothetical protein